LACGFKILAVSAKKCTPQKTIMSYAAFLEAWANAKLSPTKSAMDCISSLT
jgi:hypothetical protein